MAEDTPRKPSTGRHAKAKPMAGEGSLPRKMSFFDKITRFGEPGGLPSMRKKDKEHEQDTLKQIKSKLEFQSLKVIEITA